jgi:hypothetical protein
LSTQPVHPDGCHTGCCVFGFVCSSPFRTLKGDVERLDAMLAAERARTSTAIPAFAALGNGSMRWRKSGGAFGGGG